VPFILRAVQVDGANVTYLKRRYQLWLSRDIGGEIKAGCFVQDARGRWFVALREVADELPTGAGEIGIDLGLQALGEHHPADRESSWSVGAMQEYRTGRHRVFAPHVHLVFVTKYRRDVLSQPAIRDLSPMFDKVCVDFGASLIA
jgi:hypothetical protein